MFWPKEIWGRFGDSLADFKATPVPCVSLSSDCAEHEPLAHIRADTPPVQDPATVSEPWQSVCFEPVGPPFSKSLRDLQRGA